MQTLGDVRTVVLSRVPDVNDRVPLLINELLSLFSIDILYPCCTRYSGSLSIRERGSCAMIALHAFQMHTAPPTDEKKTLIGLSKPLPSCCHHHVSSIHMEIIHTFWEQTLLPKFRVSQAELMVACWADGSEMAWNIYSCARAFIQQDMDPNLFLYNLEVWNGKGEWGNWRRCLSKTSNIDMLNGIMRTWPGAFNHMHRVQRVRSGCGRN